MRMTTVLQSAFIDLWSGNQKLTFFFFVHRKGLEFWSWRLYFLKSAGLFSPGIRSEMVGSEES